jgi:hypothetical protein
LIEASVRLLEARDAHGRYGVYLDYGPGGRTLVTLAADGSGLVCEHEEDERVSGRNSSPLALGNGFRSDAYHRLLISVRGGGVEVHVDRWRVAPVTAAPSGTASVGLITIGVSGAFDGVSVSPYGQR